MSDTSSTVSAPGGQGGKSFFYLPPEVRALIYNHLLLSPIPLPPTPPQSKQHVHTAILRVSRRIYQEAVNILYENNLYSIHLRSALDKVAYEPFLSHLSAANATMIKDVEIVLWGYHCEDDGDTMSFGTENFGIPLGNLIHAPKLVVSIDIIVTDAEMVEARSSQDSATFCAFDWLITTFVDEWVFDKTCFDLFRAVARFHMKRMFNHRHIRQCESRWFRQARAIPELEQHERDHLWKLEERYGLTHEDDEERSSGIEGEGNWKSMKNRAETPQEEEELEDEEDDVDESGNDESSCHELG